MSQELYFHWDPIRKRFAVRMFTYGGDNSVLYVGDVEADSLEKIAVPKELLNANDMSIVYIAPLK